VSSTSLSYGEEEGEREKKKKGKGKEYHEFLNRTSSTARKSFAKSALQQEGKEKGKKSREKRSRPLDGMAHPADLATTFLIVSGQEKKGGKKGKRE